MLSSGLVFVDGVEDGEEERGRDTTSYTTSIEAGSVRPIDWSREGSEELGRKGISGTQLGNLSASSGEERGK